MFYIHLTISAPVSSALSRFQATAVLPDRLLLFEHRTGSSICTRVPYGNCRCCHCNGTVSGSQCHPCTARLIRTSDIYKLHLRKVRFFKGSLSSILRIGIPAGLQAAMYSLSNIIIQTALNALGTDTVAAWTSFGKMDAFCWMVISAFGISATTFVGQNYAPGNMTA
mgnify:CR=1 FL=1